MRKGAKQKEIGNNNKPKHRVAEVWFNLIIEKV